MPITAASFERVVEGKAADGVLSMYSYEISGS